VDPFFNAMFVFASAWLDAKFGATGWADCIRDDRLLKYIVDSRFDKRLAAEEVDAAARDFSSLARMDLRKGRVRGGRGEGECRPCVGRSAQALRVRRHIARF
jgi:hypothetical protein